MVRNVNQDSCKKVSNFFSCLFLSLLVLSWASPLFALAPDPDLNNDGTVNILDASIVGSCFGADLSVNTQCLCADTDDSGTVDLTDINFVTGAFGQSGFPVGPNVCVALQNTSPVADAGPDQAALIGDVVTVDGSGSSDGDGDSLTFFWSILSEPSGSSAALSDPTAIMPTFFANAAGTYVVQLIVNDGTENSGPDTVMISTDNSPPVANAGPDQSVLVMDTVTLDGSGSSDVDGDPLTFQWSLTAPVGSAATLSNPTAVMSTFVADVAGMYVAKLMVNDGTVDSAPDTVMISTDNSLPVANAGPDQTVLVNDMVTLDGRSSSDVDGDSLTFRWGLTAPVGSVATLSDSTAVMPTFVADVAGPYVAQLMVNDGTVDSVPDTVVITTDNSPPAANAGPNQNVQVGEMVQLDGSASSDVDNDPLTFVWALTTIPTGSSTTLSNASLGNPTFVPDRAGPYVAQLIVNDGNVNSAPDTVTITATARPEVTIAPTDAIASETGPNTATFTVTRTGSTTTALTVFYGTTGSAINGADYQILVGTVVIPVNQATADIIIVPIDDPIDEGPESVVLNIIADATYTIGTPGIGNAIIADNDVVVTMTATDPNASEVGLKPGEFTVTRTGGDLTQQVLVHVQRGGTAINGTDYVSIGGSTFFVTIPANQTSATVMITPIADAVSEPNETVSLSILANAAYAIGTPGSDTVTIADLRNINIADVTVGEDLQQTVNIVLDERPLSPTTVTVTVSSGTIATISGNATTEGGNSLTFRNATSALVGRIFVQGRRQGVAVITVQAVGYIDGLSNVQVDPSGFNIVGGSILLNENDANMTFQVRASRLNPTTLTRVADQPLRGGLSVNVEVSSSNPTAGVILDSPVMFNANQSIGIVTFDPLTAGVMTISVTNPPGFNAVISPPVSIVIVS